MHFWKKVVFLNLHRGVLCDTPLIPLTPIASTNMFWFFSFIFYQGLISYLLFIIKYTKKQSNKTIENKAKNVNMFINAQGWKSRVVALIFAKIPGRWVHAFWNKSQRGGRGGVILFWVFCILINKLKTCQGGWEVTHPLPPTICFGSSWQRTSSPIFIVEDFSCIYCDCGNVFDPTSSSVINSAFEENLFWPVPRVPQPAVETNQVEQIRILNDCRNGPINLWKHFCGCILMSLNSLNFKICC